MTANVGTQGTQVIIQEVAIFALVTSTAVRTRLAAIVRTLVTVSSRRVVAIYAAVTRGS